MDSWDHCHEECDMTGCVAFEFWETGHYSGEPNFCQHWFDEEDFGMGPMFEDFIEPPFIEDFDMLDPAFGGPALDMMMPEDMMMGGFT